MPLVSAVSAKSSAKFKSSVHFRWTDKIDESRDEDNDRNTYSLGSSRLQVKDPTTMIDLALFDVSFNNTGNYCLLTFTKSWGLDSLAITQWSLKMQTVGEGSRTLCDYYQSNRSPRIDSESLTHQWAVPWLNGPNFFDLNKVVDVDLRFDFEHIEKSGQSEPFIPDKESTIKESIKRACFSSEFSDIKIICEGKEFPCHKLILSLRSSVFKRMFSSDWKSEPTLPIKDVSADTMETFLKFLYTDELELDEINPNLLVLADKYDFKKLVNICVNHFGNIIDTKNAMEIAYTAYVVSNEELLKKASGFIIKNAGAIKKPEQWDEIKKTHPQIATKVMDLIVFEHEESPNCKRIRTEEYHKSE